MKLCMHRMIYQRWKPGGPQTTDFYKSKHNKSSAADGLVIAIGLPMDDRKRSFDAYGDYAEPKRVRTAPGILLMPVLQTPLISQTIWLKTSSHAF